MNETPAQRAATRMPTQAELLAKATQLRGDDIAARFISGTIEDVWELANLFEALQKAYSEELSIAEAARKYVEADESAADALASGDTDAKITAYKAVGEAYSALRAAVQGDQS